MTVRGVLLSSVAVAVLVSACTSESERTRGSPAPPASGTGLNATPEPRPATPLRVEDGTFLTPERTSAVLGLFADPRADRQQLRAAIDDILVYRDLRFVAVLIEMIDAGAGLRSAFDPVVVDALRELTGQPFGRSWDDWVAWYARTELRPPPGFASWKAHTLRTVDDRFGDFLTDEARHTIRIEDIAWGGVPVDGIVPLDNAPTIAAADATYLEAGEPVIGLVVNGEARAYPLRIMDAHELANDIVGGRQIALVHCTLCGSAIAYDTTLENGTVLSFGTSGLLYQSNKLMYDRQTRSLWQQFTGRPVVGALVPEVGLESPRLRLIPTVITTWRDWRLAHENTTVLSLETGRGRGYTLGYPYLEYFASGEPIFPLARRSILLPAKTWVYGLTAGETARAYPLRDLARAGVTNDRIGDLDVVLVAPHAVIDVEAEAAVVGILQYEAGGTVRAYERPRGRQFTSGGAVDMLRDDAGNIWRVTEEGLIGPDGEVAPRVVGTLSFWFGWFSFHPRTEVFGR